MAASKVPVPRSRSHFLFVGIKGSVVALKREDGEIAWSTPLPRGAGLVPLIVEDGFVFAASSGEVSCLEARTGKLVWHNKLKGYGTSYATFAGAPDIGAVAAMQAAAAAAAGAASAAS